jgi:hypothetical protein
MNKEELAVRAKQIIDEHSGGAVAAVILDLFDALEAAEAERDYLADEMTYHTPCARYMWWECPHFNQRCPNIQQPPSPPHNYTIAGCWIAYVRDRIEQIKRSRQAKQEQLNEKTAEAQNE